MNVSRERLREDIEANAEFGRIDVEADEGHGRTVLTGTRADRHAREYLVERLEAERGVTTRFERGFDLEPTPMSERCRRVAQAAGERAGIETTDLHSGATHDTMHVAAVTDAGMLFAPSRNGVSHSPKEWTDWADCAAATRVLAGALADLAGARCPPVDNPPKYMNSYSYVVPGIYNRTGGQPAP